VNRFSDKEGIVDRSGCWAWIALDDQIMVVLWVAFLSIR